MIPFAVRCIRGDESVRVLITTEHFNPVLIQSLKDTYRGPASSTIVWSNRHSLEDISGMLVKYLADHPEVEQVVYRTHHHADKSKDISQDPKIHFVFDDVG